MLLNKKPRTAMAKKHLGPRWRSGWNGCPLQNSELMEEWLNIESNWTSWPMGVVSTKWSSLFRFSLLCSSLFAYGFLASHDPDFSLNFFLPQCLWQSFFVWTGLCRDIHFNHARHPYQPRRISFVVVTFNFYPQSWPNSRSYITVPNHDVVF